MRTRGALTLNDENGRFRAGNRANKVQPVRQRPVAHLQAVVRDGAGFPLRVPEDGVNGVPLQEQRVGAVVDVLSAKVPDVDAKGLVVWLLEVPADYVNTFSGRFIRIELIVFILDFVRK